MYLPFPLGIASSSMSQQMEQTLECIYHFIQTYVQERGHPPSLREIAAGCYVGRSTVLRYLDRLEIQGRITRTVGVPRSIRLLDTDK